MFSDRNDAGKQLAQRLQYLVDDDPVVVGLPRGGVPVACEVAQALGAPLDVILVRKLGVPMQPELAMGAIGENGIRVLNTDVIAMAGVPAYEVNAVEAREQTELERRARRYRPGRTRIPLTGRVVVVVDDGIATGSTAKAACAVARAEGARRVVLAVPVGPVDWNYRLARAADEMVSVATPRLFSGIGQFYRDFTQTTDEQVVACLDLVAASQGEVSTRSSLEEDPPPSLRNIQITTGSGRLSGDLDVPEHARAVVVFAHGSGSSRHSPRNRYVASVLNKAGLATLLFDLLTQGEEWGRENVFDIELLGKRLIEVTRLVGGQPDLGGLPVAYFGASTGAAAAVRAAAEVTVPVASIVSRGGRPDLAGPHLAAVRAPTLLIVGDHDPVVLRLNREAQAELTCESRLEVVAGASHLFEEPGTLQTAAELARDWFLDHLLTDRATPRRQ